MTREVSFDAYESEAGALVEGGVYIRQLLGGRWVGPEWVKELLEEGPAIWDRPELAAIASAVRAGLDPDVVCATYRLGGKRAVLELVEEP